MARKRKSTIRHLLNPLTLFRLAHVLSCPVCYSTVQSVVSERNQQEATTAAEMVHKLLRDAGIQGQEIHLEPPQNLTYNPELFPKSYEGHDFVPDHQDTVAQPGCIFWGSDKVACLRAEGHPIHHEGWDQLQDQVARTPGQEPS